MGRRFSEENSKNSRNETGIKVETDRGGEGVEKRTNNEHLFITSHTSFLYFHIIVPV